MVAHFDFVAIKSPLNHLPLLFSNFLKVTKVHSIFSIKAEKEMERGAALLTIQALIFDLRLY